MREPGFDVRRHTFTRAFRGCDPAEVEAVLQAAAIDVDEAHATLRQLEGILAEASAEAEQLLQGERSVIRVMRSADEHARMCIGSAHRQAARLVETAEEHARALLAGAEEERSALTNEVRAIEQRRAHILAELGELIDTVSTFSGGNAQAADAVPQMRAQDGARVAERAAPPDPVGDVVVTGPLPVSNAVTECVVSPLASIGGPAAVVSSRPAAAPDTMNGNDEERGVAAFDEEGVVARAARRLVTLSTRRAAMVAAAVVLSAAAIAWPSVQRSGRTSAAVAAVPVPVAPFVHGAEDGAASPTPTETPAEATPVAPLVLALKSSRPCWMRVTVDGVPEEIMLAAGDEIARTAKATIRVRIGDAAALTVEINGHALPPLGRPGQVVDRTFTADNLPR